ncbi:MAG: hypothetical protein AUG49_19840 [Catenulispora sp. 13_1_20CM_3_70_7]|nr:MAG: hypothetical protein AUG49_19840 [Catenulispora sp. 13_1_20CM_3_70_7]
MTDNHDGTLTVKVDKPSGIAGANNELKHKGSRVVVIQAKDGCPSIESFAAPEHGNGKETIGIKLGNGGTPGSITVQASGVPAGQTALVAFKFDGGKVTAAMVPVKDPVPTCVSMPAPPPAGSGGVVDGHGGGVQDHRGPGDQAGLDESTK